jgi:nickel/cobalt transporter (NicO) family protein
VLDRRATQAQSRGARGLAALLVPFGAAASPDLTILPVFLAASALGAGAALGSLAVFAIVTVVTIVGLTVATALGARLLTAPWIDRGANLLTAGTLLLIGALVVSGLV